MNMISLFRRGGEPGRGILLNYFVKVNMLAGVFIIRNQGRREITTHYASNACEIKRYGFFPSYEKKNMSRNDSEEFISSV